MSEKKENFQGVKILNSLTYGLWHNKQSYFCATDL